MYRLYSHYLSVCMDKLSSSDDLSYKEACFLTSKQNHSLYGVNVVLREYIDMEKKFSSIISNSNDNSDHFVERYRENIHFICFRVLEISDKKVKIGIMTKRINHNNDWLFHYNSSKKNVIEIDTELTHPHGSIEAYVSIMLSGNAIKINDVFVWLFIFDEMNISTDLRFSLPTIIFNLGDIYNGVNGQGHIEMKKFITEAEQKFIG